MTKMTKAAAVLVAASLSFTISAEAATIASGATAVDDTGGINASGGTSVASVHSAYDNSATSIASDWVWVGDVKTNDAATYTFEFDLSGWDLTTVVLSGLWGVDNLGAVLLNGVEIASFGSVSRSTFNVLSSYGASTGFVDGLNTLTFNLQDAGGQAAFRATALVEGDALQLLQPPQDEYEDDYEDEIEVAPVPLPAGILFGLTGIAALVGFRRRA